MAVRLCFGCTATTAALSFAFHQLIYFVWLSAWATQTNTRLQASDPYVGWQVSRVSVSPCHGASGVQLRGYMCLKALIGG